MPDDNKSTTPSPPGGEQKPAAEKQSGAVQPTPAGKPPNPAAAPPRPAPPAKPAGPVPVPWDSPMITQLKRQYGSGIEPLSYLGQNYMIVDRSLIPEVLQVLRNEEEFDYCVDITAVHYPKRDKQFDVAWVLYSFARNERIRVTTRITDGETIASSVPLWATANW